MITNPEVITNKVVFGKIISDYLTDIAKIPCVALTHKGCYFINNLQLKQAIENAPLWIKILIKFEGNWEGGNNA